MNRTKQELINKAQHVGEFHEEEIIEIGDESIYYKCHFYSCEFVGSSGFCAFIDCVFKSQVDMPFKRVSFFIVEFHDCHFDNTP